MPLVSDPAGQGLWVNPDRKSGDPGVFALVIGVSRYDHLAEGAAPAPETYGLGQLAVSALTAYRFFAWLRDAYVLQGWPIARARLLLSPQRQGVAKSGADELEGCDAAICANAQEATFANCRRAIENWYADMQALAPSAAGRSLFFFSGHGLELRQSHQVLLPCDYLRPPTQPRDESISTRNLIDCLPYLPHVSSHVLLLDGCRNDADKLRGSKVAGADILNDDMPGATNPLFEKAVLYSTASGLRSYQPKSGGISLFGQALLDGLSSKPDPVLDEAPIELRRKGTVSTVEINKLTSYMKGRVAALIKASKESVLQIVRSDVSSADPGLPIELAQIAVPPSGPMVEEVMANGGRRGVRKRKVPLPGAAPAAQRDTWLQQRYSAEKTPGTLLPKNAARLRHVDRLHDVFDSEAITYPWMDELRVTGLSTHGTAKQAAIEIISVAHAERMVELHRVQIHFRLPQDDPVGHVLTISDGHGRRFGCVLPHDKMHAVYQLEIDVGQSEAGEDSFIRFAAYVSPRNPWPLGQAGKVWEQLRALNAFAATDMAQRSHFAIDIEQAFRASTSALRSKVDSPLAATVGAVVLLKGNRFDLMHDWARNLGNWFTWISDGVVLWTEQCRRMAAGRPLDPTLIPWFVAELSCRSLPFTAEGFGLAADIVREIQRGRIKTDASTQQAAKALGERIDAAMPYFRENGLFCTYAAWPDNWAPARMLGLPAGKPGPAARKRGPGAATKQRKPSPAAKTRKPPRPR